MLKSISIAWSEGVADHESATLLATVQRTLLSLYLRLPSALEAPPIEVRAFGNWVIPALAPDSPYWGVQWYVGSAYDAVLEQVIAPTFLELVRTEPWQTSDPHLDIALLDQDLTDFPAPLAHLRRDRYTVGTSLPGTAAVLSVGRIRRLGTSASQRTALARLVRHALGHVLGVPSFARPAHTVRHGLELHCANRCVMRGASSVDELVALAVDEAELGWPFCSECSQELLDILVKQSFTWN